MSLDTHLRAVPIQGRAKARVEAILAAARQHYEAEGRDHFNFDGVAALAGCSVATVYRYYSDRVALMDAIFPDRDQAELKLSAIRALRTLESSATEKWLSVEHILDMD